MRVISSVSAESAIHSDVLVTSERNQGLACRVVARCVEVAGSKMSAFIPRPRDYGATAPKAFGAGGKGIRTPDLLIANETLYQLSYTPMQRAGKYHATEIFQQRIFHAPKALTLFGCTRIRATCRVSIVSSRVA